MEERVLKREDSIYNAGLSVRTLNCISQYNVRTIGDLLDIDRYELMKTKRFGKKCLEEVDRLRCYVENEEYKPSNVSEVDMSSIIHSVVDCVQKSYAKGIVDGCNLMEGAIWTILEDKLSKGEVNELKCQVDALLEEYAIK